MKTSIVVFLLFSLVFGVGMAWAQGGGSNCSIPPFIRQGAPPNVLLDISVETPMQGAADPDIACTGDPTTDTYLCPPAACRSSVSGCGNVSNCYDNDVEYYGYFDPDKCYTYAGTGSTGRFEPSSITANHQCSGAWSGNFLNWATITAIDAVRKAFTGGNRDTLDGSPEAPDETYLLRANQTLSEGHNWFPIKRIDNAGNYTTHSGTVYIINKGKGFAVASDCDPNVNLDANGFPTGASEDELGVYTARVKVCDPSVGLESNCRAYGGNYKPVGVMQRYADTMRFGLITYALGPDDATNPSNRASSNGGVIRANMKWICPTIPKGLKYHDSGGNLVQCTTTGGCTNPEAEINADGTFVHDPDGIGGGNNSGVINYLNQFGYQQGYKSHDPISEMYYEAIRYFKALPNPSVPQPTDLYCRFDDGTIIPATDDGFPVYCNRSGLSWRDPIIYPCQQNFIVALNDAYPWLDKRLPGTFFTTDAYNADIPDEIDDYHPDGYVDHGEPTTPDTAINVRTLTNLVGAMEGINGTTKNCIGCDPYFDEGEDPRCSDLECDDKYITNLGDVHGTCWGATRRNSYYIAGLAYYAHTNDLRTSAQGNDLEGMQNITTYVIDSQEANPQMLVGQMNMLYLAAKYGGFTDRNNNDQPDVRSEWDKDSPGDPGYGFPDTYFFASDPSKVEGALEQTFGEILQRTSSGTAVSVLSTSAEGEGSLFQAFFNPAVYEGSRPISWVGYLNAMWVDQYGNLRENTVVDTNPALVLDEDYVIEFDLSATGETVVHRYHDADGNGLIDIGTDFVDTIDLSELTPIYDYGKILAEDTAEGDRTIYTFKDENWDRTLDTDEWVEFTTANAADLQEYLNAADLAEAQFIINYIRGAPLSVTGTTCRNREIDGDIWKLGDIVNSTPSVVGRPMGQYHLIYGDTTYLPFIQKYKNRETIVYVGANDGMLHAFSAGEYHEGDDLSTAGKTERGWYEGSDRGKEKWAFIPYNLLPHLKWLTDQDYCHVYYVDLKARVVDARIFTPDADHPNGWGTVLIGAMRFGGPDITGASWGTPPYYRTFRSAFFALDITNPESADYPKLLWEYTSYVGNTNFTTSYPTTIRRGPEDEAGDWYVIFGSGPSTFDGAGSTTGYVYIRNLLTGDLVRRFDLAIGGDPFFMATPISIDKELDYDVDVAYIGATYNDSGTWKGKMFRIDLDYELTTSWNASTFFSADKPITTAPTAALDPFNHLWLFWGSGRYFSDADKTDSTTQRLYGVWDPGTGTLDKDNLNNVTLIKVHEGGYVDFNGDGTYSGGDKPFVDYLSDVRTQYNTPSKYGWYLDMPATGERSLAKSTLLGDIVLFPTFDPNDDLCDYGGDSYLYALYYETGTAYRESVIGLGSNTLDVGGPKQENLKKKYLGLGMPTSVVIHAGRQQGVTGMIQLGTGVVEEVDITPAALPQSKVLFWREKTD